MNKVGVCEWCLPVNGPFALDFAARAGFDGIQLGDLGGSQKGFPMMNEFIREGYKEAAERTGVILHSMHLYTMVRDAGHIYPMDSPEGELATTSIRNGIDSCVAMGIPCLNISAFFQSNVNSEYDWKNLLDHLVYAVEYGRDKGIYVAYEPGVPLRKIEEILDKIPEITLNYDLTNPRSLGLGEPLQELVAIDTKRIDHVHVKDSRRNEFGKYMGPCFAGEGSGKIKEAIKLLTDRGYDKWYLSESNYLNPASYGVGNDTGLVCKRDCEAIRKLVEESYVSLE